ncbi:Cytochrome P450 [Glarea lozoyensis ATCC 20868]|uniref:Cytochrome P450 n=1 Tax=Glarea lozoyensis (strain ATCC 20868 / MF5171) TaxID=1116229 RepID=S3CHK7_GLAL2|nr:Cytochrome P450 [Glarea lozoyensis ATCC 20868]EPE25320.1 Cytochrome P450 [Glarea lozoyensis ATCC 20868]
MYIFERALAIWQASSYTQCALYLTFTFIFYFFIVFTYRLTFHPLARYPGPFFARISDWPLVIYCYRGDRHLWELKNHLKYGPIVRYGANSLSISTPTSLPLIHGPKANVKKGSWYKTLDISAGAPSVQMEINKHAHALRRRFLAPAFSERALKNAEKLITVSALKLSKNLGLGGEEGWSEAKNMNDWATYFGFDFISDLGYGSSFGMLDGQENRWIPGVLKSASVFLYYVGYLPFIDFVRPLMGTAIQDYISQDAADSLKYTEMANSRLAARMELERKLKIEGKETSRKDTFHYLLNSKDAVTGKTFTKEELQADSALIIAAGSDGVAITIAACMFYLLKNPEAMGRLVKEIREAFSSVEEIRNPKLNTLLYLHACIEETLRMNPPKPSTLPREVLQGGLTIDENHFPKGVNIGSPLYVMHHDPSIFPEPWSFKPERFIASESTAERVAAARAVSAPFLIGPMNCIGKNMSFIALKLALAHVLFSNDVRISGKLTGGGGKDEEEGREREDEYQMQDWIIGFRDGPMIEVRKRSLVET